MKCTKAVRITVHRAVGVGLAPHGPAAVVASKSDDEQSILEALTFDLTRTGAKVL